MEIVVRATIVYFFLWIVSRGLGKRELSEMSPFELVLLVVMGDLVEKSVTHDDMSVTGGLLAVATMAAWLLMFSYTTWRWKGLRTPLEGQPIVVVRDGKVDERALAIERLPVDDLLQAARAQGIPDLGEVRFAVLEPEGVISFVKRES